MFKKMLGKAKKKKKNPEFAFWENIFFNFAKISLFWQKSVDFCWKYLEITQNTFKMFLQKDIRFFQDFCEIWGNFRLQGKKILTDWPYLRGLLIKQPWYFIFIA